MAKAKKNEDEFAAPTAHGISEDHPDETVEEWADRVRSGEGAEAETLEQAEKALEAQETAAEETGNG